MSIRYKIVLACLFLFCIAPMSQAQEDNSVYCFHVEIKNGTSKFMNYLLNRYGVEHSEQILLKTKAYEAEHDVFVLFSADYHPLMEQISAKLAATTDPQMIASLKAKKAKLVLFESIENIVNH